MPTTDEQGEQRDDVGKADARILGQLLAAQNVLSVLPTSQHIADFYARALLTVPGVSASHVCFPDARSHQGAHDGTCAGCQERRGARSGEAALAAGLDCELARRPGACVIPLQTATSRFGSFVLQLARPELFEHYRPFISNLGNFLALSLENRQQQGRLERARDALELRVEERTEELRSANRALAAEIEQRRAAEAAVRELNLELEQRVAQRTTELEAANEELEAFAYSASHDLRAPLRHIVGFLELLQKKTAGSLDAQAEHYVVTALEAGMRLGRLIDDLLAFSRMGRHEPTRGQVDLSALVRDVVKELEPETSSRSVRWSVGELPVVTGDGAMLRAALVNLVSNALKFTRPRPVAEIEIDRRPGPEAEQVIFVRDNGVGFDPAYAGKLFGVFARLHPEAEFEGNGIGLANVRRIVQRHGGRTWAEGAVDRGATFYLSLPQRARKPE